MFFNVIKTNPRPKKHLFNCFKLLGKVNGADANFNSIDMSLSGILMIHRSIFALAA